MKVTAWALVCFFGITAGLSSSVEAGQDFLRQGKPVEAIYAFRKVLREDPKSMSAHAGLASAMYALARYEEVMTVFPEEIKKGNIDLNKKNHEAFTVLKMIGFASFRNRQSKKAIVALSIAIKIRDDDPSIYNTLGLAYLNTGSARLSEIAFRTAVNLDQENPVYVNNLGASYLEQRLYREALICFEKSVRLDPKYQNGWDNVWMGREKMNLASMRGQYKYSYFLTATESEKKQGATDLQARNEAEKKRMDAIQARKKAEEEAQKRAAEAKKRDEDRKRAEEEKRKLELIRQTNTAEQISSSKPRSMETLTNAQPVRSGSTNS